jgi:hypothetical protein
MNFGPKRNGRGIGRVLVGLGALMSLAMIPASAVTNETGEYTFTTSTDPYAILALNNNTASGSIGVQANSYAPGGKGIYGYSDASGAPGFGVAGISQNGYGVYGSSYGSGISAIYAENLSSGVGIGMQGASANGTGVYGNGYEYGVEGVSSDTCSSGSCPEYAGVYGLDNAGSYPGAYGVVGVAQFNHTGVAGFGGTGLGVYGSSGTSTGTYGYSSSGNGVYAYSGTGTALEAFSPGIGGVAYLGGPAGEAGIFHGYSGSSAHPAVSITAETAGTDNIGTYNSGGETFIVQAGTADASGTAYGNGTDVQISGDLYVAGEVYTDCVGHFPGIAGDCGNDPLFRQRGSSGATVQTYAAKQSMRSVEDFGEGQLINGAGRVALDPTFASTIAMNRPYLVFITPEGDSRGLYVTGKTLGGFTVRESSSGHSSIAFQYRIVAHPVDDSGARMAAIAPANRSTTSYNIPRVDGRALKSVAGIRLQRPAVGARVTRPPQIWVRNLHRN